MCKNVRKFIRFSEDENERLKFLAEREGVATFSSLVRKKVLQEPVLEFKINSMEKSISDLKKQNEELLKQIKKMFGGLIKDEIIN